MKEICSRSFKNNSEGNSLFLCLHKINRFLKYFLRLLWVIDSIYNNEVLLLCWNKQNKYKYQAKKIITKSQLLKLEYFSWCTDFCFCFPDSRFYYPIIYYILKYKFILLFYLLFIIFPHYSFVIVKTLNHEIYSFNKFLRVQCIIVDYRCNVV